MSTEDLKKKAGKVLRADIDPSVRPKSEGLSDSTRTITETEMQFAEQDRLHGVVFDKGIMNSLYDDAVKVIEDYEGTIVNDKNLKSSDEWFTHTDPNNGASYLLPLTAFSEQDTSTWFYIVLGKSALGYVSILKAVRDKLQEDGPEYAGVKTRDRTRVTVNLHPTEPHKSLRAFLSSAPPFKPKTIGVPKEPRPETTPPTANEDRTRSAPKNTKQPKKQSGASIPDWVLTFEGVGVCTIEMKTASSMTNTIFQKNYDQTVDYKNVVIPFTWPSIYAINVCETKLLVQVPFLLLERDRKTDLCQGFLPDGASRH